MTETECEHERLVKSSPVIETARFRHCRCRLCGDKKTFTVPLHSAPKKKKQGVSTYILHSPATRKVKIGKAANITERLQRIQACSPDTLVLLRVLEGDHERTLHKHFAKYHSHFEWFDECEEMLSLADGENSLIQPKRVPLGVRKVKAK